MVAWTDTPPQDLLAEAAAEKAFDARAVLSRIEAPVLLLCGDHPVFREGHMSDPIHTVIGGDLK